MATRRQRERKARQRAWHNGVARSPTGLPLIGIWIDEVNAFVPEPYSFGPAPGPGYDASWIEDKRQAWGPEYRQQVLGKWPAVEEWHP